MNHKKRYKIKYSYGVICFRKNENNELEYMLVKRRFTYSFFDFLFGNYDLTNIRYINKLISRMTKQEKFHLHNVQTFDGLWELMWGKDNAKDNRRFYHYNYDLGISNFKKIKEGYYVNDSFYSLRKFLMKNRSYYDSEWGFPKGKKNTDEDNTQCALREFEEETGIKDYELLKINNIYETHKGMNDVIYKTFLFFITTNKRFININQRDKSEISDIRWFSSTVLHEKLREYQHSIVTTIDIAEKKINEYYNNKSLVIEEIATSAIINKEEKFEEEVEEESEEEDYSAFVCMFGGDSEEEDKNNIDCDYNNEYQVYYDQCEQDAYNMIKTMFGGD